MTSDSRLMKLGALAEWENEAKILSIKIHGLRNLIHAETDQFKPIDAVNVSALRVALDDLCEADLKLMHLKTKLRDIRDDLGINGAPPL